MNAGEGASRNGGSEPRPASPPPAPPPPSSLEEFSAHRRLLFDTAYRMTGSVADAEDLLQDTWLAWSAADRGGVANPRAYLVRTVTNLALNRLTSARARREAYVGPWLPEPLLTGPDTAAGRAETADDVSFAMLVVLESLSPLERAVFVLREVFGYSHAEIAAALGRGEATVRQTAHRAREHVQARRPRYDTDERQRRDVTERFMAACTGGDVNAVMELLAPGVTAWSDGGGVVTAARRPIHGPAQVAKWATGVMAKPHLAGMTMRPTGINGEQGIVFSLDGRPVGALAYDLAGGVMLNLRLVVNPEKLRGLAGSHAL